MGPLSALTDWVLDRLSLGSEVSPWMVALAFGLIALTAAYDPIWHTARNVVTIVHEMGHVLVARLCGRSISGIRLHSDTSGLAVTRGKSTGLGMLLTAVAGYPAPGVVGALLVWAATTAHAGAALIGVALMLVAALLLVRNLWGLLVIAVSLLGTLAVLNAGRPKVITALVLTVGVFLAIGSVRATWDLIRAHRRGDGTPSDAHDAARSSVLPAVGWLGFFLAVTVTCGLLSVGLIVSTQFR
ncbi:M50 family metallopeptidase [Calidifontibacter terrae]